MILGLCECCGFIFMLWFCEIYVKLGIFALIIGTGWTREQKNRGWIFGFCRQVGTVWIFVNYWIGENCWNVYCRLPMILDKFLCRFVTFWYFVCESRIFYWICPVNSSWNLVNVFIIVSYCFGEKLQNFYFRLFMLLGSFVWSFIN